MKILSDGDDEGVKGGGKMMSEYFGVMNIYEFNIKNW